MRIIGGYAKGIQLLSPSGRDVRPTSDRVREAIFSALGDVTAKVVIDLFAGTGALGLEALSRGATSVTFVERSRTNTGLIKKNLERVQKAHPALEDACVHIQSVDIQRWLQKQAGYSEAPDIIFADPPYQAKIPGDIDAANVVCDTEFAQWADDAMLVLEHAADVPIFKNGNRSLWGPKKQKRYGNTCVSFLVRRQDQLV